MMQDKRDPGISERIVRIIDSLVELFVLAVLMLLLAVGIYALWDSRQLYEDAKPTVFAVYKPEVNEGLSFEQLRAVNPDVFAWLTVFGTSIDYPITQTDDNETYVNTDAMGRYSLTGNLFLDFRNDRSFQSFNSIIYGHNMVGNAMFGELRLFGEKEYFEAHLYGNLYYEGKDHGVEFFEFLNADAYDFSVYSPVIEDTSKKEEYLDNILNKASGKRNIDVSSRDKLLLLSTCASETTNGRNILVGRITDQTYENPFNSVKTAESTAKAGNGNTDTRIWHHIPVFVWITELILFMILLASSVFEILRYRRRMRT